MYFGGVRDAREGHTHAMNVWTHWHTVHKDALEQDARVDAGLRLLGVIDTARAMTDVRRERAR